MSSEPVRNPRISLEAVTPSRLADTVAERLRRYIVTNELRAGDRLPSERQLAVMLETSRATVSQALRTLSIAGLVAVRHGSGAYVRTDPSSLLGVSFDVMFDPGPDSVSELAEFSFWIEKGLLSIDSDHSFDVAAVRDAFDDLERADASIGDFIEADARFHVAIIAGTGNRYHTALFEAVHRKILHATYSGWIASGRSPDWISGRRFEDRVDLHRRIMDAALDGQNEDLERALGDHRQVLLEHIAAPVGER